MHSFDHVEDTSKGLIIKLTIVITGVNFMPSFKCKDIGMKCDFTAEAKTQDELMKKISAHAASAHGMKTVPAETMTAIKKAIKK